MRPEYELAGVINRFGSGLLAKTKLTPLQIRVLDKIAGCRTAALGGHEEVCDDCGKVRYSYNSCGDRHCPRCQSSRQAFWIEDLMQNTLAVKHYHIVFTLPDQLNAVCLHNQRMFYNLMFSAVWNTLRSFGYTHYGVECGAVAVLHTWGQNLSLHPHIHCIVPAVGYALEGKWKNIGVSGKYLFPVHQLSQAFKGKFLDSLKRALRKQDELSMFNDKVQHAYRAQWVVHCEPSLADAGHVVKYLGQYTHRVAITNRRIVNIDLDKVTFMAKDYRKGGINRQVTLDGIEFLRRFTLHVLPRRFVKIRRYGIYNPTLIRIHKLQFTPEEKPYFQSIINKQKGPETTLQRIERLTGIHPGRCPVCKTGCMVVTRRLPRIRSPSGWLSQNSLRMQP